MGFALVFAYIKAVKVWLGIFEKELTEVKNISLKSSGNKALTFSPKNINH